MNDRIERHLETGNPRLFIPRVLDEVMFDVLGLTPTYGVGAGG